MACRDISLARGRGLSLAWLLAFSSTAPAADESPSAFLQFVRARAGEMRAGDAVPETGLAWEVRARSLRSKLSQAWGGFPAEPAPLEARVLGVLPREGYRIEKIMFQTLPDVWMTANAYVPAGKGKHAAVLCVHGHWRGAKQDPVVQARCLGLVKLGYFVLVVDAFGAGERAVGKALGEYHGEMSAATLLPTGRPLSGLQVYENQRAVDYLLTRPEVDGDRIGITGASGGGNQSMYAGAWDQRLKAAAPVCSVGNYQAYLGAACCLCEVVPGALRFTEESGVLSLTAPRALLVINASRDARQFSVAEAKKSLAAVQPVYDLLGHPDHLRHATFESGHDYSQPMRETVYGWMHRHLLGAGDGSPVAEPPSPTEDPEVLRCFPGDSRPEDWMTLPRYAAREGRRLRDALAMPADPDAWDSTAAKLRARLEVDVLGGTLPGPGAASGSKATDPEGDAWTRLEFAPEPGLRLTLNRRPGTNGRGTLILDLDGTSRGRAQTLVQTVAESGGTAYTLDLRATGIHADPRDRIGRAPDHNTAEWSLWIGRPLLGQWVLDVRAALDALEFRKALPRRLTVVGLGPAGVVALCATVLEPRLGRVITVGSLASFVSEVPYENQRLGILAPGILRDVGDIPHLAALVSPRPVIVAGAVRGSGVALATGALTREYAFARGVHLLGGRMGESLGFRDPEDLPALLAE